MTKNGFTIVELLIVIVVIGILAAITLVAFGGIRERAENNKTVSAVSQYVKAIKAYRATFGTLPVANYACLGEHKTPTADMCANTTTTASDCFGAGRAFTRIEMQTEMRKVISAMPQPSTQKISCGVAEYAGAWYHSADGQSGIINYYLAGALSECPSVGLEITNRTVVGNGTSCRVAL